jgi:thiol-disulfide isomerase/thioredoxin
LTEELIVYHSRDCPACIKTLPEIKKLAKENGVRLKIKEVEKCKKTDMECRRVGLVPTVMYHGAEVPLESLGLKMKILGKR